MPRLQTANIVPQQRYNNPKSMQSTWQIFRLLLLQWIACLTCADLTRAACSLPTAASSEAFIYTGSLIVSSNQTSPQKNQKKTAAGKAQARHPYSAANSLASSLSLLSQRANCLLLVHLVDSLPD